MVILHGAIKTIQNGVFPFSSKKRTNLVLFFKKQKKTKKTSGLFFFFKKNEFFSTLCRRNINSEFLNNACRYAKQSLPTTEKVHFIYTFTCSTYKLHMLVQHP